MADDYSRNERHADAMRHFRKPQSQKASPARLLALEVTEEVRLREAFAHDVLEAKLREMREEGKSLSPVDRAFATTLTLGVVQTRGTLDEIINKALDDPSDIKPNVRDALRVSTYEIIFLGKSSHAAVDQGVELVRSVVPRAAGLGNAVLRRIVKMAPSFPFGDPETDDEAFTRQQAFPYWLARMLYRDLGPRAARIHMQTSNEPAPLFVAINRAKCPDDDQALEVFEQLGASCEPVSLMGDVVPGCYRIGDTTVVRDGRVRHLISSGQLLVSDASSQSVANMVVQGAFACWKKANRPTSSPSVLEIGAGRATKTILLQSDALRLAGTQIALTCLDNQEFKVNLLKKRTETYGIKVEKALVGDGTDLSASISDQLYDCVFLDSPCTGVGTLRRHPEIRWRIRSRDIRDAAALSSALLCEAAQHVAVGGMLVYATCTVMQEENVGVVKGLLDSDFGKKFKVLPIDGHAAFAMALSSGSPDAHFAMRLVRVCE